MVPMTNLGVFFDRMAKLLHKGGEWVGAYGLDELKKMMKSIKFPEA